MFERVIQMAVSPTRRSLCGKRGISCKYHAISIKECIQINRFLGSKMADGFRETRHPDKILEKVSAVGVQLSGIVYSWFTIMTELFRVGTLESFTLTNDSEHWMPRGVGRNGHGEPDLSGFVKSKESGERVIAMVARIIGTTPKSYLDYRSYEPNWIQVKIQGADGFDLDKLYDLCNTDGIITEDRLRQSLR